MPLLCNYTSNTSGTEFDKILRYFETTAENILFDDNLARVSKLSHTLQKISTLQHLAKASKNSKGSQVQTHEPKNKKAKIEKFDLPNEIWLNIINHLSTKDVFQNFALVCKRFHNFTNDASALKTITLRNASQMSVKTMENLKKVLQRSKKLQKLEFSEDRSFGITTIIKCCFESCPQLNALTLTGYGMYNSSLLYNKSITWKTKVQHLRLSVDFPFEMHHSSKFINLRTLTIDVARYGSGFMNQLGQECKKLEKVTILTVRRGVISEFIESIVTLKDSLKYLTVEKFEFDPTGANTLELSLDKLRACKNLQELSLDALPFNGNELLKAISKIPKLFKLELKNLGKLGNEYIELLAQNCKELKCLKFDNCPSIHLENDTVSSFIDNCPQLTKLSFHWAMVGKISNEIWQKANVKSIDVFITVGKKTFTIQKYLTMINSK